MPCSAIAMLAEPSTAIAVRLQERRAAKERALTGRNVAFMKDTGGGCWEAIAMHGTVVGALQLCRWHVGFPQLTAVYVHTHLAPFCDAPCPGVPPPGGRVPAHACWMGCRVCYCIFNTQQQWPRTVHAVHCQPASLATRRCSGRAHADQQVTLVCGGSSCSGGGSGGAAVDTATGWETL